MTQQSWAEGLAAVVQEMHRRSALPFSGYMTDKVQTFHIVANDKSIVVHHTHDL